MAAVAKGSAAATSSNDMLAMVEPLQGPSPRWYQVKCHNEVVIALRDGARRIMIKLPTGTGKTKTSLLVSLSQAVREVLGVPFGEKLRVLFLSHRHRLNRQAQIEYGPYGSIEIIPQSAMSDIPKSVMERGWHITIMDEAHHEAAMGVQLLLDKLKDKPMIGLTADDQRYDNLLCKFERVIAPLTEREAAESGYIEKAGINSILDFSDNDKVPVTTEIVDLYGHCMGNTIVFFNTMSECERFHRWCGERGIASHLVATDTSEEELDSMLDDLAASRVQFVINCQRIGEGVDVPNCTDVFLARFFNSPAEKRQFIGRAIRADSPCAVWELFNPVVNSVTAREVVGLTKYERLIFRKDGAWTEQLVSGEDPTWGRMRELRRNPQAAKALERMQERREQGLLMINRRIERADGPALTAKARGVDTNINPLDDVIKLALRRGQTGKVLRINGKDISLLTMERRRRGEVKRTTVKVTHKRSRRAA